MTSMLPADGLVRVFPLPNVALLPHGYLPLHIFEPRYRQMVNDALADDRMFAMAFPERWNVPEPIPLKKTACLGRITAERRLPGGRFDLMLIGQTRICIEEELLTDKLYRIVRASLPAETAAATLATRREVQKAEIIRLMNEAKSEMLRGIGKQIRGFAPLGVSPGGFADLVANIAPLSVELKQQLLEAFDVDRRLEMLVTAMAAIETDSATADESHFPPEISPN